MTQIEKPQLRMVWPNHFLNQPPSVYLPEGYSIRTFRPVDKEQFYTLMRLVGFPIDNDEQFKLAYSKLIPNRWFMILDDLLNTIVATAMCLHNYKDLAPPWGTVGWLACDPEHQGKGLGYSISAAVTGRFIESGYTNIELYTEYYRLPALKTYLKLGYTPHLYSDEVSEIWTDVCKQVNWPYTPDEWLIGG
ncbi:GNAT family N-acetyltransferase [Chloroflexi bacterium TSY]|nr:GNAT family N-acetyltransferase [Chloroflexi bacterium TSY]